MKQPCCASFHIYASLRSLPSRRNQSSTHDRGITEQITMERLNFIAPDTILDMRLFSNDEQRTGTKKKHERSNTTTTEAYPQSGRNDNLNSECISTESVNFLSSDEVTMTGSSYEEKEERDTNNAIYDCEGAAEE